MGGMGVWMTSDIAVGDSAVDVGTDVVGDTGGAVGSGVIVGGTGVNVGSGVRVGSCMVGVHCGVAVWIAAIVMSGAK